MSGNERGRMNIQDELNCPICLESFRSPVTTDCGHSFCIDCISKYWDKEAPSYNCPDCRRTFSNRPKLAKSISLSRISEALQGAIAAPRAVPRTRCPSHGRELAFYCRKERVAICSQCASQDHKNHETVTLEEEAELTREPIVQRQNLVELNLRATLDKITTWKDRADSLQVSLQRIGAEVEQEFGELTVAVKKARDEVGGLLQRAERDLLHQSRDAVTQLEQHMAQLGQEQLHLQTLLGQQDHLQLLEGSQTLKMTPDCPVRLAAQSEVPAHLINLSLATTVLSDQLRAQLEVFTQLNVPVSATAAQEVRWTEPPEKQSCPHTIPRPDTTTLPAACLAAEKQTLSMPRPLEENHTEPHTRHELLHSAETLTFSMPRPLQDSHKEPGTRDELLHYLTVVTFDSNTASNQLLLSEDGRSAVSSFFEPQQYPDHPKRFNRLPQVLGLQEFSSGRHYWEMWITGSPVLIGLAYSNMSRKGRGTSCFLGLNHASWCLQLAEGTGTALHSQHKDHLGPVPYQRIGLYLDYPGQALSFYGITDRANLLHRFQATFTQPLLPAFQINRLASVRIGDKSQNPETRVRIGN